MSNLKEHTHTLLQSIYDTSYDMCKAIDEHEINLSILHGIVHAAHLPTTWCIDEVDEVNKTINTLLDRVYESCATLCTQTNSKSVALPVLKILIEVTQRNL